MKHVGNLNRAFGLALLVVVAGVAVGIFSHSQQVLPENDRPGPLRESKESPTKPSPSDVGFVGSKVCARCHEAVAEKYDHHPMAHSMMAVNDFLVAEGNEFQDVLIEPPGSRKYLVRREANHLFHHEVLPDKSGDPVYDQNVEVSWVLGSGTRGRAFLIERDGRLFASPLNWYTQTKQWGLAPGYPPESHKRFEREAGDGCLICHAGQMNVDSNRPNVYSSPAVLEPAIGCERCHGPGQNHVVYHDQAAHLRSDYDVDPIVNPIKLDSARREDVCNQCHLQGQSQQLRYGRHAFDFRPGMRLEDVWLIFLEGRRESSDEPAPAVSQVEQMRNSACFVRSEGRFGCLTCHDAHSIPAPTEHAEFYRQRCRTCHTENESGCKLSLPERVPEANSCIACHMPRLGAANVPHTTQTDHRIRRRPDAAHPPKAIQAISPEMVFFDGADQRISKWEVDRARGLVLAKKAETTRTRGLAVEAMALLEATRKNAPDDVDTIEWLGVTKLLIGKTAEANEHWKSGLALKPHSESLLVRLAFFSHDMKDLRGAAAYFDRLFEVNPAHAAFHGRQAHILGQLGDFERAIQEAHQAIELDPTLSQAHEWLAHVYQLRRQEELSKHHLGIARKLHQAGF